MGDVVSFPHSRMPETDLIPEATKALETIRALEGVNRTDAVNRALQLYAELLEQRERGMTVAFVGPKRGLRRREVIGLRWNNPFTDTSPED